jgi:hypothetical protein
VSSFGLVSYHSESLIAASASKGALFGPTFTSACLAGLLRAKILIEKQI